MKIQNFLFHTLIHTSHGHHVRHEENNRAGNTTLWVFSVQIREIMYHERYINIINTRT